jgi:ubiquinone/menaquinone biosynthesis C-methylase UbiE
VSDAGATASFVAGLANDGGDRPVLELGAGTGRLALAIAAHQLDVVGIDASRRMAERLRAKLVGSGVRVVVGDMAALPLRPVPRFSVVLVACNTLFNLTTPGAQQSCFGAVARVLTRGGRFVVEAFVPDPRAPAGERVETRTIASRAVTVRSVHDPIAQRITGCYVDGTGRGREWQVRYHTPDQLDLFARDAGLRLERRHGGWHREPFTDDSDVHVSVYRAEG